MPRMVLTLTALLCFLSPALANLSPRPASPPADDTLAAPLAALLPQDRPLPPDVVQAVNPRERNPEFRITSRTEVTVDGRSCGYADVPKNATILKMEVDSDNGTIVTIRFRSKK